MIESFITFFAKRHVLTNAIFVIVLVAGVFSWNHTNKEELPAVTFDFARISVSYPGATAADVEYFVTKPIEEQIRGLDGVYRITSSSSIGQANISVELEDTSDGLDAIVAEIRNEVLDVELPEEVIQDPRIRVFQTDKKAILDIALIHENYSVLDTKGRTELQHLAFAFENQLLSLPEVHDVTRRGYLQKEIQIKIHPDKLHRYDIPFNTVMREIRNNHIRKPAGTLETDKEPKVTLVSELNTPEKLRNLVIQGGFEGNVIRLADVADIEYGFEKNSSIQKVNGREAVMFNVVKSSGTGILEALDAVRKQVEQFQKNNLVDSPIDLVLLDDESIDVRNRLNIIAVNGGIGFALILITLFLFLNGQAGLWVAMGIPFTFCFTITFASLLGNTINGITLAAVIIVMGIVVDDAIVVAENIARLQQKGMDRLKATVQGTAYVFQPILASIVTTCVAFVPLYFFQARHGKLIEFIPPIIFLMLGASLFESTLILPGHMNLSWRRSPKSTGNTSPKTHWFDRIETVYAKSLTALLPFRILILTAFAGLLFLAFNVITEKMSYEMFPNEETRDVVLAGYTPPGSTRYETAEKVLEIERLILPYVGNEVVGFRTDIAQSRRGSAVEENRFRITIEIVPRKKRKRSADAFIEGMENEIRSLSGFQKVRFQKSRWGQDSGSPIEVIIQQNSDPIRNDVAATIASQMKTLPFLKNVEIEESLRVPEYRIEIDNEMIKRLDITPGDVASTLRSALEGTVLYEYSDGNEDVDVRFTTLDSAKRNMEEVLDLPVENQRNYLVPLRSVVKVTEHSAPSSIEREELKRTTRIFADMNNEAYRTPLEIAEYLEANVFTGILTAYPTTRLSFGGEIRDSLEAKTDLKNAMILVLVFIFLILAILFESLWKPVVIMLTIPFGIAGIIFAFHLHGKDLYGFYAVIGALGLAGVIVNDSIIMLTKLTDEFDSGGDRRSIHPEVARITATRLRAVLLTTLTTVVGILPTAYGFAGYDAMLAEMMLALTWGMIFGTLITLLLIPCIYASLLHTFYTYRQRRSS